MARVRAFLLVLPLLLLATVIAGCGGESDEKSFPSVSGGDASASRDFDTSDDEFRPDSPMDAGAFDPAPAPDALSAGPASGSPSRGESFDQDTASTVANSLDGQVQAVAALDRIIVRTVDMTLIVQDVSSAVDDIAELATTSGGWVVSSRRDGRDSAFISFRVPAEGLESALEEVRELTVEVESENSTAEDVTDEFTDLEARIRSQKASEDALVELLGEARTVSNTLEVQTALAVVREDIESMEGRLNLLAQTSAFSLVNVYLNAEPMEMIVDAGSDRAVAVGQPVAFTATLNPPEGIDEFEIEWDFGDGYGQANIYRTAATLVEGQRITSAVTHFYQSEKNSPFVVTVEIKGRGDAGAAEGEDTLVATVSEIPVLDVFAGEFVTVEAGKRVGFAGTFTRPEGLDDLTYRWEFGDGSSAVEGVLEPGVTVAEATHTYANSRPVPYTATLVISGTADVGEIEGRSSVGVRVEEAESWVIADWNVGDTFKDGVQALSAVGIYGVRGLIWAAALSPVWIPLVVVFGFGWWRWRKRRA
ncbi:MAG: DUF4349 domain-containing protein [SAR202 cluster bacterium]|jgi:hypothetical protein|nr:DUF4349 domain-containing protein [SAR202 cluster bacterium]